MFDPDKAEIRKEKRLRQVMMRSILAAGIGLGLFFLRFLVAPFIGDNEEALKAIASFAFALMGFGAVMIVVFLSRRDWAPRVYLAMVWVVLPVILLKLLAGVF